MDVVVIQSANILERKISKSWGLSVCEKEEFLEIIVVFGIGQILIS